MTTNIVSENTNTALTPHVGDVLTKQALQFVNQYQSFFKKSAQHFVEMGKTVYQAQQSLAPVDLKAFCQAVSLDPEGSTFRKLMKIGEHADLFIEYLDRLPCEWTNLYYLAGMENDKFIALVTHEQFSPNLPLKEIKDIAVANGWAKEKNASKKKADNTEADNVSAEDVAKSALIISIDLTSLKETDARQACQAIDELSKKYRFTVTETDSVLALKRHVKTHTLH